MVCKEATTSLPIGATRSTGNNLQSLASSLAERCIERIDISVRGPRVRALERCEKRQEACALAKVCLLGFRLCKLCSTTRTYGEESKTTDLFRAYLVVKRPMTKMIKMGGRSARHPPSFLCLFSPSSPFLFSLTPQPTIQNPGSHR